SNCSRTSGHAPVGLPLRSSRQGHDRGPADGAERMKLRLPLAILAILSLPVCAQQSPAPTPGTVAADRAAEQSPESASQPAPAPAPAVPAPDPKTQATYDACMANLRGKAIAAGVSGAAFDEQAVGLVPDMSVLDLLDSQPEFKTPIWDYLAGLV